MPPKSDLAQLTQLEVLEFLTAKSTRADFAVANTEWHLQVEATAPSVFRLRCGPVSLLNPEKPSARARAQAEMLLARPDAVGELAVSSLHNAEISGWRIEQGEVALEIGVQPFSLSLYKGDECLLHTTQSALACGQLDDEPVWRLGLDLDENDAIYGLGETLGDLDRRGETLISDLAESRALPLAWNPVGWGIYVNTVDRVEHDVGASQGDTYRIDAHGAVLDFYLFVGDPGEVINQYTALTGRAGQPGLWPLGVWLDQAPGQSTESLLDTARALRAAEVAFDAVQLAAPAPYGFQPDKPNFEWDSARVEDPRTLLAEFGELNLHVAAPTFPGVLQDSELFAEWEDRGWLLLRDDGDAHVFPGDAASAGKPYALLDLTNKDVYRLWSERQRQISEEGLSAPVCDARFDIPDDVSGRSGESGAQLRTVYPMLVRRALFDAVAGHKTPQEGLVLSTDLFPSVQRYAWQQGPVVANTWKGFAQSFRAALATANCGVPAQTHTLGSAHAPTDEMTPELYIRWLSACVFSANFSFQATPALLPTSFDSATRELVHHWLQWRYRLIPYVLGIIEDAVRTGTPVQRSMAMAFPDDVMAHVWDSQYMFGPALLVAPLMQPGNEIQVYLPEGDAWWDMNTGWRYEGGTTLTVQAGLETLPIFGREGHMLCLGPAAQHTGEFNSARILEEVWMFGMPEHSPVVMRNKIRVMQMQGSSYIKGLEGLKILPSEGLEVKRRGAEVRISRVR